MLSCITKRSEPHPTIPIILFRGDGGMKEGWRTTLQPVCLLSLGCHGFSYFLKQCFCSGTAFSHARNNLFSFISQSTTNLRLLHERDVSECFLGVMVVVVMVVMQGNH